MLGLRFHLFGDGYEEKPDVGFVDYGGLRADLYFYAGARKYCVVEVGYSRCACGTGFDDLYWVGYLNWSVVEVKVQKQVDVLLRGGVIIPDPLNVFVGEEVDPERISREVVLHPGTRLSGADMSIGFGCEIGAEAPVTVDNCQLGRQVRLKGGYVSGSVFLDGASMGSGAHIRPGCILEEEANGAHSVGLKQTILMPFVTLGSIINFCDVFMAGGTNRKDHSEVGSSYIHFNYTPHQDKATASLIGDVPKGVFLKQKPIFLGGQGGLVGPARIAYGTVVAAGGICRQNIFEENQLHIPAQPDAMTRPYETGVYRSITRILKNNLCYIGNMAALKEWYLFVRKALMHRDRFDIACYEGGLQNIEAVLHERIRRLDELAVKIKHSLERLESEKASPALIAEQRTFIDAWPAIQFELKQGDWAEDREAKEVFLSVLDTIPIGGAYIDVIQSMQPKNRQLGHLWLQSIVDGITSLCPPQ